MKLENISDLEYAMHEALLEDSRTYFLFLNTWDTDCKYFLNNVPKDNNIHVIDFFDVPNGIQIMRSYLKEYAEGISTYPLDTFSKAPCLIRLSSQGLSMTDSNNLIAREFGI